MFIIALFTKASSWKQLEHPPKEFGHTKEQNTNIVIWMKSHKHYAKQKKSYTKG